jgi:7-keto-8-aminopelargonate synthetase-like enzyme
MARRWRLQSGQGVRVRMGGHIFLNFASDDYLDLAADPRLARAAAKTAIRYGCGAGASVLFTGNLPPHRELERAIVEREGCEAALVFDSIVTANFTMLRALAGPRDAVFCDARNNAVLKDGCDLTGGMVHYYRHGDLVRLESLLRIEGARAKRRLVVTESLFGFEGDLAPLGEILTLAEKHDAFVVLDESHAEGIWGARGRGATDDLPVGAPGRHRLIKTCALNKSFGSQGAFVCGPQNLLSVASTNSGLVAATGALGLPAVAAARRGLSLADQESDRGRRVLALAQRLRSQLEANGLNHSKACSHIVPVMLRSSSVAVRLSRRLEVMGLLVPAIVAPFVRRGLARLRVSLTAGHTDADIDRLVKSLLEVRAALSV